MRRWAYGALALVLGAALAGCGGGGAKYKYRVAVIPKGMTHEFWQSIHRGAERAAADLKDKGIAVEILWDGPLKESDSQEQINLVEKHVGTGDSGIVLAPQHSKTM